MTYRPEPISAFDVPAELTGLRTLFTSLHHFRPDDVRRLLSDAVAKHQPIAAFESLERNVPTMFKVGTFTFLSGILATHRVGPLTPARAVFTYVLPLAPFFYSFDGLISCLRTYTPEDLQKITADLGSNYHWEIGQLDARHQFGPYKITYLIGLPQNGNAGTGSGVDCGTAQPLRQTPTAIDSRPLQLDVAGKSSSASDHPLSLWERVRVRALCFSKTNNSPIAIDSSV